jgi:HlyD family type I secretion membrane fusion protein
LAFFGGLGGWAATAPLVGAVIAPAVVAPVGQRKSIQHLEGGIVREILVREGQGVAAEQALVVLDDTQLRAELRELQAHWHARRAALARLVAESRGSATILFDPDLLSARDRDPTLAAAMSAESAQLVARRAALHGRTAVLERRAEKERQAMAGLVAAADSFSDQLELIREEIDGVQQLRAKGLETKPRLLALQRVRSQLEGDLASAHAGVRESREAIAEAELEAASLRAAQAAQVAEDLATNQAEAAQLEQRLATARDRLSRAVVRAPVAGTVASEAGRATGGGTARGASNLDLVPAGVDLVLDARVAPQDVDEVHAGQSAQVYLTAYQTRRLPRVLARWNGFRRTC